MILKLPLTINAAKQYQAPYKFNLNLNEYRNLHHRRLNTAKFNYTNRVHDIVLGTYGVKHPTFTKVKLLYSLYRTDKRLCDVANICSVVDKFTCDALVKLLVLPEDTYEHVVEVQYKWGGIIKEDPHVKLAIIEVE